MTYRIEKPHYPIVYVRGYAMRPSEREETFYDTYYGLAASSVEKRQAPPPAYFKADVFEGQLIRFMKMKDYAYADSANGGEAFHANPSRSLWICRFYDEDFMTEKLRSIEAHAEDLRKLVCEVIPKRLKDNGVDLGADDLDYKVILVAHSMGGLVCRTLMQNLLPKAKQDPKRWVHRLVTMGTPHRGIDLGRIPDFIENFFVKHLNPFDAGIFKEERMRKYLRLKKTEDVHSLGGTPFPISRCLCLIGSDYQSYSIVEKATGNYSDGLVRQDSAYMVSGPQPANGRYGPRESAFWANVHRAHSGRRGIVNSYESFENIQRFLFGNIRADITLEDIQISTEQAANWKYFYDFEFQLSIRGTNTYLHRRQQEPCENAIRKPRAEIVSAPSLFLHTAFLNSNLRKDPTAPSKFCLTLRVVEHRVEPGLLWDHEYPGRQIYCETLEIGIADKDTKTPGEVEYRWLSDTEGWKTAEPVAGAYRIPLRPAGTLSALLVIKPGPWPDDSTMDNS